MQIISFAGWFVNLPRKNTESGRIRMFLRFHGPSGNESKMQGGDRRDSIDGCLGGKDLDKMLIE